MAKTKLKIVEDQIELPGIPKKNPFGFIKNINYFESEIRLLKYYPMSDKISVLEYSELIGYIEKSDLKDYSDYFALTDEIYYELDKNKIENEFKGKEEIARKIKLIKEIYSKAKRKLVFKQIYESIYEELDDNNIEKLIIIPEKDGFYKIKTKFTNNPNKDSDK